MKSKALLLAAVAALSLSQLARADASVRRAATRQPSSSRTRPQDATRTAPQSATAGAEKWERYTYAGEEFSVEMPEMPYVFESTRGIDEMKAETMRTFGLYSGGVVFMVTSFDNPRKQETLDRLALFHWNARPLNRVRDVKLGGFDGREYNYVGGLRARALVFRAKSHAYLVWAITYGADDPRVARFLDSFTLGGKPAGVSIYEQQPPLAYVVPAEPTQATPPGPAPAPGDNVEDGPKPTKLEGAPHAHAAGEPYRAAEVTRKAVVIFKPAPGYTEKARRDGVAGIVRVRVVLASDGHVRDMSIVKGLPAGLTEKAVNAARHILFFPAEVDGRPVSQYVTLEYNFNIVY